MHAADAQSDPKCKRIIHQCGMAGYGAVWFLVEQMRRDAMLQIQRSDIDLYAADMRMEEVLLEEIISLALAVGLFVESDGLITAPALVREIENFEEKRDNWRTSKRQQRDKRRTSQNVPQDKEEEDPEEEEEEDKEEDPEEVLAEPPCCTAQPPAPKSRPKPIFNPEGKTKYLDWVYLSTDQYKRVVKYYEEKGLDYNDFKEAVRELDRWFGDNPKKRLKRTDDAKALMGWPLDRALERRQRLLNTQAAERRLKEQAA